MHKDKEVVLNNVNRSAWPFKEAEAILERINHAIPSKGYVLFETGYGPSGFPHIGTWGEVARTIMVKFAFEQICDIPTILRCISDDMDGMRKLPDLITDKVAYTKYIGLPLTKVPDPFGTHDSFAHNMNSRMKAFLDQFCFEYQFFSSAECYASGMYNEYLLKVLEHYDEIMAVMLPTLGQERQETYSPFLPICHRTGRVLQVNIVARHLNDATISYIDEETNELITVSIFNGHCKLQWKPDFGMRWAAFDVDFEMYGKDHLVNGTIYSAICKIIGGKPPHQMFYELFLDEKGQKISKSKGNGVTLEQWLKYAPKESLAYFMYQSPQRAKKLYFDVIPKYVDEYLTYITKYHAESEEARLNNPVHFIHTGNPPIYSAPEISYSILLNIISACNCNNAEVLWGYIRKFNNSLSPECDTILDSMVKSAISYYEDFIAHNKVYRTPSIEEHSALLQLLQALEQIGSNSLNAEELQAIIYQIGSSSGIEMKNWFKCLYEILLGAQSGPRFGSFIALYGVDKTSELIRSKLSIA